MSSAFEWVGVALAGGLTGNIVTKLFDWRVNKKTATNIEANTEKTEAESLKVDADAAAVIVSTAMTLIKPLQSQIAELTARVVILEAEGLVDKSKVELAVGHIRDLLSWASTHIPNKIPPHPPVGLGL